MLWGIFATKDNTVSSFQKKIELMYKLIFRITNYFLNDVDKIRQFCQTLLQMLSQLNILRFFYKLMKKPDKTYILFLCVTWRTKVTLLFDDFSKLIFLVIYQL